jgi:hypothetical protein
MAGMTTNSPPMFMPLTGLFEPSAIQQLPDGRFLVVEDEKEHPFSLLTLGADGAVQSKPMGPGWFQSGNPFWKLEDLEGLTIDSAGYLYAVTSHSRDDDGDEKKSRDKLVRFQIESDRVVGPVVVGGLKPALVAAHPVLAAAAQIQDAKSDEGFNIEALEITPDRQRLLIGFRSPLDGGLALIASVENPAAVFEADAPPQVSGTLQTLDLGGQGIRSMSYIASLNGYLIVGGPTSPGGDAFKLWFWSGEPTALARRVTIAGLHGLARAEGVSQALIDGAVHIVIVSDEGNRKEGKFASFLLLDATELQIAA